MGTGPVVVEARPGCSGEARALQAALLVEAFAPRPERQRAAL